MDLLTLIIVVLVALWLLGYFAAPAVAGSAIHVLVVIALILFIVRLARGQKVL